MQNRSFLFVVLDFWSGLYTCWKCNLPLSCMTAGQEIGDFFRQTAVCLLIYELYCLYQCFLTCAGVLSYHHEGNIYTTTVTIPCGTTLTNPTHSYIYNVRLKLKSNSIQTFRTDKLIQS